ncbi:MAG TPA: SIMPL domain-containing protein [Cyclobacteriaceae bacterium]|nr:SIMPL domain-containing protein [Cyclobacteriaceae bacterium]
MPLLNRFIAPSIIVTAGLILCTLIISISWKQHREANQSIAVTGSAKRQITADLGILRGILNTEGVTAQIAFENLERQKPLLLAYLRDNGFSQDQVKFFPVNSWTNQEYNAQGMPTGSIRSVSYSQRFEIQSNDVKLISRLSLDMAALIRKGVNIYIEMPEYYFTSLAELKVAIQADAAKDAMLRAEEIAKATGRKLGILTSARMGVIQITPLNSNMITDYGVNDVSSIEKEITGVVNASFLIQ